MKTNRTVRKSGPQPIGNVIAEIVSRTGIGRQRSAEARQAAWHEAVGQAFVGATRCGDIRRRKLEVIVANSLVMQELMFQKEEILARFRKAVPDVQIDDLRFRVGAVADAN
jgi:predicted nucleic acid-binding Zn ribbon protein